MTAAPATVRADATLVSASVRVPLLVSPLVGADWLARELDAVIVVDTRSVAEYLDGHVPGAAAFPLSALLIEDTRASSLAQLARAAREAFAMRGIGPDSYVVFVDDGDGSASLGVLMAELAGISRASALHGGMREWLMCGGATANELSVRPGVASWAGTGAELEGLASFERLYSAGLDATARLVDTRSQLEHEGIIGAQCCNGRGHIPGSAHVEWTSFIAGTGALRQAKRVVDELWTTGLDIEDPIITYCHDGRRAAFTTLALRAAGFRNVRCSIGGWHEWSSHGLPSSVDAR